MKNYKYLLFDLDDTLIDNFENTKHAFKVTLDYMGIEYSDEIFSEWLAHEKKFWHLRERQGSELQVPDEYKKSVDTMVQWVRSQRFILFFNDIIDLNKAMELNDVYLNAMNEKVVPIKNAFDVMKKLYGKYNIFVATNGPSIATKGKLSKIGCLDFVDDIFSADMFGVMKPSEKYFAEIKQRTGEPNSEKYLVIGDSLTTDVEGAINSGMDSCWFNLKNEKSSNLNLKPTYEICELNELLKILNTRNRCREQPCKSY